MSAVDYTPGKRNRPMCDAEDDFLAEYTDEPELVAGCAACLELVAEDLADFQQYQGRCLHCRSEIVVVGGVAWRRAVRSPCPYCGRLGW